MGDRSRRFILNHCWPAALGCAVLLCGCEPARQTIEAEDGTFFPGGRVILRFPMDGVAPPNEKTEKAEALEAAPVVGVLGAELDFAAAQGTTEAGIGSGAPAELHRAEIPGPATIRVDYELYDSSAAFMPGFWVYKILGIEGLVGMGFRQLNLKASAGEIHDAEDMFSMGPLVGGRLTVRPLGTAKGWDWFGIYGRGVLSYQVGDRARETTSETGELGIELGPFRHLGVYGGWRWWSFTRDRSSDDSKVKLDLDGPVVGLLLTF